MGQIGSTEMYLILENFGITVMSSGLILIAGSRAYVIGVLTVLSTTVRILLSDFS